MCFFSSKKKKVPQKNLIKPRQSSRKKVILLGDTHVGKTMICEYYKQQIPPKKQPQTIGISHYEFQIKSSSGIEVNLDVWDTAGQEVYKSLLRMYYQDAHIVFLIFDLSIRKTFERVEFWEQELSEIVDEKQMHLVLIGNKCDLPDSERQIKSADAELYAKQRNMPYFETSGLTGQGVLELFDKTVNAVLEKDTQK